MIAHPPIPVIPTTSGSISRLPYPGLRPFERNEADIFFGREEQTDELLKRLDRSRFLAIVGPSGCGKSSLFRAGMIASLEAGFMLRAGVHWRTAIMRPGSHPIMRLARALLSESALGMERPATAESLAFLQAALRRGPLSLVEILEEIQLPQGTNLLLGVDQFEEIVRFHREGHVDEAQAFVELLLESVSQLKIPIYVVITMRSEFIGDCAMFPGLPEALNQSQYLTPRLSRDQLYQAIEGPARVFLGDVDPALANRVLNELGTDPAQLPVMQHLLMRMWMHAKLRTGVRAGDGLVLPEFVGAPSDTDGHRLCMEDYVAVGGVEGALSKHADEALGELDPRQQAIAEVMFRRLCERIGARDLRRPAALDEIASIAEVNIEEVLRVVEVFRDSRYGFLVPAVPERLYPNTIIDITHESLIGQWKKLSGWVEDEKRSIVTYRFLEETARRWDNHEAALWDTPNLEIALSWRDREHPTREWAQRHGGNFGLAMRFLEASAEQQRDRLERAKAEYTRKLRRARALAFSLGILAVALVGGILLWRYLWVWDYPSYYSEFSKFGGEPRSVGKELSSKQLSHRTASIKMIKKGRLGRVRRMEVIDSRGQPTTQHGIGTYLESSEERAPTEVAWEFSYDNSGQVSYERAFDIRGRNVWSFVYLPSRPNTMGVRTGYYVEQNGYPREDKKNSASLVEIEDRVTTAGTDEFVRYRNRGDQPIRGPDNAFGQLRHYNKEGKLLELISLGPDDQPMDDKSGNARLRVTELNKWGDPREEAALDASQVPTITKEGWSIRRSEYDENGELTSEAYFDASGNKALHVKGYHRITMTRDEHGNITEESYFNTSDEATVNDDGCYILTFEYDQDQNPAEMDCRRRDGSLTSNKKGYAVWKARHDRFHDILDMTFYNSAMQPVSSSEGYARVLFQYDDAGDVTVVDYLGPDARPVLGKDGYARFIQSYDDHQRLLGASFFGVDGKPIARREGYASWTQELDNYGNAKQLRYYGPDGKRVVISDGIAGESRAYDASGNEILNLRLNVNDRPMLDPSGVAGWRSDFDNAGNEIRRTFLGLRGERIVSSDGVAGFMSSYDIRGNELERSYFGLDEKPVTHREGYSRYQIRYDIRSNPLEYRYFDINGAAALVPWKENASEERTGYSSIKYEYDSQDNVISVSYYGINGQRVLSSDGWARKTNKYDPRGNRVESAYFDDFGEPVLIDAGYHVVRLTYDDWGHRVDVRYFGKDKQPINSKDGYSRWATTYDDVGRVLEEKLYDKSGAPTTLKGQGFHRSTRKYDERGNLIEVDYFSADVPIATVGGYHAMTYVYDDKGNNIEISYRDLSGQLIRSKSDGYAIKRMRFDSMRHIIELTYFDENNRRTRSDDGFSRLVTTYDIAGNETSQFWFDEHDMPIDTRLGYAGKRCQYDVQGRETSVMFLGQNGNPVLVPRRDETEEWGYAAYTRKYDRYGNEVEIEYFGISGEPSIAGGGYHRLEMKYNALREMIEESTFDIEGRLVMNNAGYARVRREFDDRGHLIEISAFDENGHLTDAAYGYARLIRQYDARNNLIQESYRDANDLPMQ